MDEPHPCIRTDRRGADVVFEEGKAAPLFTLGNTVGDKVALKDLNGRYVTVYFYPCDDTPGCRV